MLAAVVANDVLARDDVPRGGLIAGWAKSENVSVGVFLSGVFYHAVVVWGRRVRSKRHGKTKT